MDRLIMPTETIRYGVQGRAATVTIARGRHNAMTELMVKETYEVLGRIADEPEIDIVVLTGDGTTFCPGADLEHVAGGQTDAAIQPMHYRCSVLLHEMPQVTLAAINGACAGAGLTWAAACDIRVAAKSARFRTAFLDVGVAGDMGGPWTLSSILGASRARQICFLPDKFSAEQALEWGLVSRVCSDETFRTEVAGMVGRLESVDREALRVLKANFCAAERMGLADFIDLETERHLRLLGRPAGRAAFGHASYRAGEVSPPPDAANDISAMTAKRNPNSDGKSLARRVTERYLELAQAGDAAAIAELYAPDAEFRPLPPNDQTIIGRQAIGDFYQSLKASTRHPVYRSTHWIENGLECCLELHVEMSDPIEHIYAVDIVTATPEGQIARLAAYRRPPPA